MQAIDDSHPLLLSNLNKTVDSSDPVIRASVGVLDGYGTKGAKQRPFRQDLAVRRFSDWVYAAALLNAHAVASVPLRLYQRKGPGSLYRSRSVNRRTKRYLRGDGRDLPSRAVVAKLAEFGDDFEEVTEPHPALKTLSAVNDWMNGFELAVLRFLYLQITGNAYVQPVCGGPNETPSELWILPSQWTRVIPGTRDDNVLIRGYLYGRPGQEYAFAGDEVIQWRLPNIGGQVSETDLLYYGKGKAEACWSALNLHDAKRTQDQARYDNFSRPDWIIGVEGASTAALQVLEASVEQRMKGVRNSGKMLAANGKVTAQALNLPDPEVGDQDKVVQEIASVFGVPLYKLLGNDPIKANSETQDTGWLRDTILPFLRMDEEQLNAKYLPLFGIEDDAVLAYDNPIAENEAAEAVRRTAYVSGTVLTPNEARAEIGMDAQDGGDTLFVPGGMVPIGLAGQQPLSSNPFASLFGGAPVSSQPSQPTTGGRVEPTVEPTAPVVDTLSPDQVDRALSVVSQVAAGTLPRDSGIALLVASGISPAKSAAVMGSAGTAKPTTPNPVETAGGDVTTGGSGAAAGTLAGPVAIEMIVSLGLPRETAEQMIADTAANKPEAEPADGVKKKSIVDGDDLIAVLKRFFAKQAASVLRGMKAVTKDEDGKPESDLGVKWDKPLADAVRPGVEAAMRAGVQAARPVLTAAGATEDIFRVVDRGIPQAAANLSLRLAASTNATTSMAIADAHAALRREINEGIAAGDTGREMRRRVQTIFTQASDSRAETIARTEAARARHTGEQQTMREAGVRRKQWVLSADACPLCDALAAKYPDGVGIDETFGQTDYGPVDGPPLHPNCTCSLTYSVDDVALGEVDRVTEVEAPEPLPERSPPENLRLTPETIPEPTSVAAPVPAAPVPPRPSMPPVNITMESEGGGATNVDEINDVLGRSADWGYTGQKLKPTDLAQAAGAQKGSAARISTTVSGRVQVSVTAPGVKIQERELYRDHNDGTFVLHNIEIGLEQTGTGLGTRIFADQVATARAIGVSRIETTAARSDGAGGYNGHYTWARLGYDGKIPFPGDLPEAYRHMKRVSELMATPEGAAAWKHYGATFEATFTLTPDGSSYSEQVLSEYLAEKQRLAQARETATGSPK